MNILQVSSMDTYGGAARIAWDLHTSYRKMGHRARMFVGGKFANDPDVALFPEVAPSTLRKLTYDFGVKVAGLHIEWKGKSLGRLFQRLSRIDPVRAWNNYWGVEDFDYQSTWRLLDLPSHDKPEIIHMHNLHANYFDLRILPALSGHYPVVLTLHDAWLLAGHCAHSLDCEKWRTGCGSCPYLDASPPINRDSSAYNWRRKRNIYANSRVYIVSPSQWLLDRAMDAGSILRQATVNARVIPNGIDLETFSSSSRLKAREELSIPKEDYVLLFVATDSKNNMYKDYTTIHSAMEQVSMQPVSKDILLLVLGGESPESRIGNTRMRFVPYMDDPAKIAKYYQAADVYLHAARAETFPTVIIEALACGLPVIATRVGGIPEQVTDGIDGFLVEPFDFQGMASRILELMGNETLRIKMGENAIRKAQISWRRENMVSNYLKYYEEIVQDWKFLRLNK